MECSQVEDKLLCKFCKKKYSTMANWNKHMRLFHPKLSKTEFKPTTKRIICPLCSHNFPNHINFRKHVFETHNINIKVTTLNFTNIDEFQIWRAQDSREENYSCFSNKQYRNSTRNIVYHCIRSNCRGNVSKATVCAPKAGGSKFINGVCPSRIVAKIAETGEVLVEFVETHVGHEDEIECKRLTKVEESKIRDQLTAGFTIERILNDAKIVENNTLKRINLLTRVDLNRIIKKFNIDYQRRPKNKIGTALKVDEHNKLGQNNAFLIKNIDEEYDDLEDFVVGNVDEIVNTGYNIQENTSVKEQNTTSALMEKIKTEIRELVETKIEKLDICNLYKVYDYIKSFNPDQFTTENIGNNGISKRR